MTEQNRIAKPLTIFPSFQSAESWNNVMNKLAEIIDKRVTTSYGAV